MKTRIQNPVLPRGVEVILEVNNIQIHSLSPHYSSAIMKFAMKNKPYRSGAT
jgi:hypothetical protein